MFFLHVQPSVTRSSSSHNTPPGLAVADRVASIVAKVSLSFHAFFLNFIFGSISSKCDNFFFYKNLNFCAFILYHDFL